MKGSLVCLTTALLFAGTACEEKTTALEPPPLPAAPASAAQPAPPAPEPLSDDDIPTQMDFEEEAARRITAESNLEAELDGIEREIGDGQGG